MSILSVVLSLILFPAAQQGPAGTCYYDPEAGPRAEVTESGYGSVTVEFNLDLLQSRPEYLEGFGQGTVLRVPGEGISADAGLPDMPAVRRMVLVPDRGSVEVRVLNMETVSLGHFNLPPFQPLRVRGEETPPIRIFRDFFEGDAFWPEEPVRLETVSILRDLRVAWVSYLPVSWNPSTGEVILTTGVTAIIRTTEEPGENEISRAPGGMTRSFLPLYREVLGFQESGSELVDGSYLVISSEEGIDLVQDLIDWKTRKGLQVETATVPAIGSTPAEIDAWIENAYATWPNPPEYILIVGDEYVVPSPQYSGHSADNIYGVLGSGCVPSIHVGRLSGSDTDDLPYIAWKITEHEMYPYQPAQSWFNKGMSIGHTEFVANSWDYVEYMMAAGLQVLWFCESGGVTPTIESLSDSIDSGYTIIGLCGHGDVTHMYPPGFGVSDVAALNNGRKLPWVALVACQVGMFDGYYCLCEAFMGEGDINSPRGAIGIMGPTTNSPYGAADSLVKWIFKGYFQEDIRHMGAVTDWSKAEVYAYFGSSAINNNHMHMIFGCPEMDIYYDTSPLTMITVDHPQPVTPGLHTFTALAGGSPLEGALVAVMINDSLSGTWMDSYYSDASGSVTFDIPAFQDSALVSVTATGFNMAPYLYQWSTELAEGPAAAGRPMSMEAGPSPCFGTLGIRCFLPEAGVYGLDIYNISGRVVRSFDIESAGGDESLVWDGRDDTGTPLSSGIYYLRLRARGPSLVRSVVILGGGD
ncbi:MAG: hypothetical protein JXR55_10890 [Candidatus Fermentibacteraceae bacterium]|nr:hypothetical protein [Candidatus Fermentibacteraceae bacterium]